MFKSWDELSVTEQLLSTISDTYKGVFGMRPNLEQYASMNEVELNAELDRLFELAAEYEVDEAEAAKVRSVEFEATVSKLIEAGANDRITAIRWLRQGMEVDNNEVLEYVFGLPFNYLKV